VTKRNWADGVLGNTPLSAARLNNLESDVNAALVALARDPDKLFAGAVQYDGNGAPISAVVKWPDGIDGTYSGTASTSFPGSVSAYTITRVLTGGSTVTYTQPAITRDPTTGNVTNRPEILVAGETVNEYVYPDPVQPSDLDTALARKINDTSSLTRATLNEAYLPVGGGKPIGKGELFLNVKDYGAKGDGITDDTAAVQAWLTAGGAYLRDVTLRITAGLTMAGDNRTLFMDNAKLIADGTDITALTVTGNNCRVRAQIDGNSKANYGIKLTGAGSVIEGCIIENLYSTTLTTRAIEVTTNDGCTIRENNIRNIVSAGDTTLGNNNGSARAIIIVGTADATTASVIKQNVINGIRGEEGDAIQVLFSGAGTSYPAAHVTIEGNDISNVSRRFIKVQASGCNILGNTLRHDGTVPTYPANAIDIIQGDNVRVEDNKIGPNPLTVQINAVGVSGDLSANIVIRNNSIRQDDTKNAVSIYCNYISESAIVDNIVHGGASAISVGNSSGVLIQNNTQFGGITSATSFSANSTNAGVVMRNNVNMASGRTTTTANTGTGALTEYNAQRP